MDDVAVGVAVGVAVVCEKFGFTDTPYLLAHNNLIVGKVSNG